MNMHLHYDDLEMDLFAILAKYGARPDTPIEAEQFFRGIIGRFAGTREECLAYIEESAGAWFRCIGDRPRWIQEPEWRYSNGNPMVFMGQIEIPGRSEWFHDDAAVYVFWDPDTGARDSVIQVA